MSELEFSDRGAAEARQKALFSRGAHQIFSAISQTTKQDFIGKITYLFCMYLHFSNR
jgi:hypothetical protein